MKVNERNKITGKLIENKNNLINKFMMTGKSKT